MAPEPQNALLELGLDQPSAIRLHKGAQQALCPPKRIGQAKRRRESLDEAPDGGDRRRSKRLQGSTVNSKGMQGLKERLEVYEQRLSNKGAPRAPRGKSVSASVMKTTEEGWDEVPTQTPSRVEGGS